MRYFYVAVTICLIASFTPRAESQERAGRQGRGGQRARTPMSWNSPEPLEPAKTYVLVNARGREIPAQADGPSKLWWLGSAGRGGSLQLKVKEGAAAEPRVKVERAADDRIDVTIDGKPFTSFHFRKGESRPYLYPVMGPTGDPMTRDWPMKHNPEEESRKYQDHPHHRSFWTAHGEVRTPDRPDEKIDYWGTERTTRTDGKAQVTYRGGNAGQQRVTRIVRTVSGPVFGLIEAEVGWVTSDGRRQLTDTRTYRFFRGSDAQRIIDYQLVLHFPESDVTFEDTKEGGLIALRIPFSMTEKPGEGQMVNSEGKKSMEACWGQPADWCDYVGPVNGKTVGIALFDAPGNFRHPTRWHIRDYGLYTANPFMAQSVDKNAPSSAHTWKKGESATFNYRVVFHVGDTEAAAIADQYASFATPPSVSITR